MSGTLPAGDAQKLADADQAARARIAADLDSSMLVEAGAGSGKTTSLIDRMYALVARGEAVERIAAVTFTRKAANELRERFQERLEHALQTAEPASETWRYCDRALRDIDRAFLGTTHAFCARILREHPLEIGLDPNFSEVTDEAWTELARGFWNRWLERCQSSSDPVLVDLARLGVDPRSLYDGFKAVMSYQDVQLPITETAKPDCTQCRAGLEALLARARGMMPAEEPDDGWDSLMQLVHRLEYQRETRDWDDIAALCPALELINKTACKVTQKRWSDSREGKEAVKQLSQDFLDLMDGDIASLLACWYEHRYPVVLRFLRLAAEEFARERHATGQLGFEDLLMLSARLLRERPQVRDSLGERYRRLLVDEFQDTDPIQAEVCFLLSSDSGQGSDWRNVTPRPGGLFLVGDPKQSIYRFRRADIQVYEFARSRMTACGVVLSLTSNFRSVSSIGDFVNRYFEGVFPRDPNGVQAPYTPMRATKVPAPDDGVSQYWVRPARNDKKTIFETDASQVASWIAARVAGGDYTPGDFLVLTAERDALASYARALGERNIPATTAGARLTQEQELTELLVVLRAVADPANSIAVVAALEGMFFGCGPADLYDASRSGLQFVMTHPPTESETIVGAALAQLYDWWIVSQRHAADVLVDRILDDTGLLYYAASQAQGDARAGALLRLVEVLRAASMSGASAITDAMDWIELLLTSDSDDAPLRPGRTDAVRVMNLHKAKGLEARVVILAAPVPAGDHAPTYHIVRGDDGVASGGIVITSGSGNSRVTIAQPYGWAAMAESERGFAAAESQRLLYVAATRAKGELLVSRCSPAKARTAKEAPLDTSAWSALGPVLDGVGRETMMEITSAPGQRSVGCSAEHIVGAVDTARRAVAAASVPSITRRTVTQSARDQHIVSRSYDLPLDRQHGQAWGRAVHRCIEAAGCGRTGDSLAAFAAAVARDEELSGDGVAELQALVTELQRSALWARLTNGGNARFELPVMRVDGDQSGPAELIEGVIDAAVLSDGEWLVVDWKTDAVHDGEWTRRSAVYEEQVGIYRQILASLSGQPASSIIQRLSGGEME